SDAPPKAPPDPILGAIVEQLRRGEIALPSFPAVLSELKVILSKPAAAMHEITALVERDPRLAAQVLRITNSAQFARGGRVHDIRTAVPRLGLRQLQNIVQTIVVRDSYTPTDAGLRRVQGRLWQYSIARAVAMRGLAELVGAGPRMEPETAYLAGLMCDA